MKRGAILLGLFLATLIMKAEGNEAETTNLTDSPTAEQTTSREVIINNRWIDMYRNMKDLGTGVSFIEVFNQLTGFERIEFVRAYGLANIETESIEEIKKRVLEEIAANELSPEEIEWYQSIKNQINTNNNDETYVLGDKIKL